MLGSSFHQAPAPLPVKFPFSLPLSFHLERCQQRLGSKHHSSFGLWFSLCPGIASPQSFGCRLPGEGELFAPSLTPCCWHMEPQNLNAARWEQSRGHSSVSQRRASHLASPLCHAPSNGHCTQISEHPAAAWEPPQPQAAWRAAGSSPEGQLLAACPCALEMAELQEALHGQKAHPAKLSSRALAPLTLSQRLQLPTQARQGDRLLDADGNIHCYWDHKVGLTSVTEATPLPHHSQSVTAPLARSSSSTCFYQQTFDASARWMESLLGLGEPKSSSWAPGSQAGLVLAQRECTNPPLLLLHHACSCIPAAAGVLSSQVPAPNPLHKEKTARTIAHFFPFFSFVHKYIQGIIHISTQTVPLGTHRSPQAKPPQPQRQPQTTAVPTETGASQPARWTGGKGGRWVE